MSIIDDIKATVASIDDDGDGIISFDDLKKLANEHGIDGSKLDEVKQNLVGADGKLSVDDATRLINDYMEDAGNFFNDLKSKFIDRR